jgi:glycylpeptide N-tetradecanoyltransferase
MVEINFLCVLKKLRSKRMAPVLIKEITRRCNLEGIFQALYTAGADLPGSISSCRYWHRSLNPEKLVDVQFSAVAPGKTLEQHCKRLRIGQVCCAIFTTLFPALGEDLA